MNKTSIEWTDYSWNPVTGCWGPHGSKEKPSWCSYCYARKMMARFNKSFEPTFHVDRLNEPLYWKKPSKIFVCSMADLFGSWLGDWVPMNVLNVIRNCPQHTFQLLTKCPENLARFNPWPDNAWVGVTATDQAMAETAVKELARVEAKVKFLSCEPLLAEIDVDVSGIDWLIIGQQTPIREATEPEIAWISWLMKLADEAGAAVFMKDNLAFHCDPLYVPFRQEWPRGTDG